MKTSALFAALLLTASLAGRAQPSWLAPPGAGRHPAAAAHQAASPALLYRLGTDRAIQDARRIDLVVRVDGSDFLKETTAVAPGQAAGGVLLLFAARPDLRAQLDRWSTEGARAIVFEVLADGHPVQQLSWRTLREASQAIRQADFEALPTTPTLTVFKLPVAPKGGRFLTSISGADSGCQDACESDREACYPETCPGLRSCQDCDDQYDLCVEACNPAPPCTDPVSVSYTSDGPHVAGSTSFGPDGCYGSGATGEIYNS